MSKKLSSQENIAQSCTTTLNNQSLLNMLVSFLPIDSQLLTLRTTSKHFHRAARFATQNYEQFLAHPLHQHIDNIKQLQTLAIIHHAQLYRYALVFLKRLENSTKMHGKMHQDQPKCHRRTPCPETIAIHSFFNLYKLVLIPLLCISPNRDAFRTIVSTPTLTRDHTYPRDQSISFTHRCTATKQHTRIKFDYKSRRKLIMTGILSVSSREGRVNIEIHDSKKNQLFYMLRHSSKPRFPQAPEFSCSIPHLISAFHCQKSGENVLSAGPFFNHIHQHYFRQYATKAAQCKGRHIAIKPKQQPTIYMKPHTLEEGAAYTQVYMTASGHWHYWREDGSHHPLVNPGKGRLANSVYITPEASDLAAQSLFESIEELAHSDPICPMPCDHKPGV